MPTESRPENDSSETRTDPDIYGQEWTEFFLHG